MTAFFEVHIVNMIKESKFKWCSSHKLCIMLSYYNFLLKEDLGNNGYSPFAEEVISKSQCAEEFIKIFSI